MLIVDDEYGPRQALYSVFRTEYEVLLAEGSRKAIEIVRDSRVDAVILDICMPEMTGTELLDELKRIDPDIQAVMLTAYQTLETARQAIRLEACDYLNKPFQIPEIRASVARAMERRQTALRHSSSDDLANTLQQRVKELQIKYEDTKTQGEIYASVLHDINNPLTIVSSLVPMLKAKISSAARLEGDDLDNVRQRLDQVAVHVDNCLEVCKRYLGYLRQNRRVAGTIRVNQVFADVEKLLRFHPDRGGNNVVFQLLPEDVAMKVNGADLIQILMNLVGNAMQCSENPHEVFVGAKVFDESLPLESLGGKIEGTEGFENAAPLLRISCSDDGPGIPLEKQARVFEAFYTERPSGEGTGLGLAIVHRLALSNNALIQLDSASGTGTTFNLYFSLGGGGYSPDSPAASE